MKKFLPFLYILSILLGNLLVIQGTYHKLSAYRINPPFRLDDFTQSYRISSQSQLSHVFQDSGKVWVKLQEGLPDKDIDLELRLTHFWDGKEFVPRSWEPLQIYPCSPSRGKLSILLREAINVDQEMRLPEDTLVSSMGFQFFPEDILENRFLSIDINPLISLKPEKVYPKGIYILVVRIKFAPSSNPPCLSKVSI